MTSVRSAGARSTGARRATTAAPRPRRASTRDTTQGPGAPERLRLAAAARVGRLGSGLLGLVLGGAAIMAVLFMVAVAGTMVIGEQAHIDRTNDRIEAAEARAKELRVELARLKSPQYVTTRAATVLGMIPAPTPVYLQPRDTDDARAAETPPASAPRRASTSPSTTVRPSPPSTVTGAR